MWRLALILSALATAGCVSQTRTSWLDRPELDLGCEAVGACSVRGRLVLGAGREGVLVRDDGRCLPVILPEETARRLARLDGRRFAVGGYALTRADLSPLSPCPESGLMLQARRVSLKAGR